MPDAEYVRISFASDNGILCRVLAEETKYGRDVLRVEYPSSSGKVRIALVFVDKFDIVVLLNAAEAESEWNEILSQKSAQRQTSSNPSSIPEICQEPNCIEPAEEMCDKDRCAAHCDEKCETQCARADEQEERDLEDFKEDY